MLDAVVTIRAVAVLALLTGAPAFGKANDAALDRTVLPIAEPHRAVTHELNARNAKAPPRFDVKAPPGAPNVVIVLIDDLGFGATSAFGGPDRHSVARPAGAGRPALHQFPHHGAVLADACRAQVRS